MKSGCACAGGEGMDSPGYIKCTLGKVIAMQKKV